MVDLTVSIVNYNTADLTLGCVRSILGGAPRSTVEIIVVDNGSDDADALERGLGEHDRDGRGTQEERVKLIRNSENLGYAAANNQAFKGSTGRHFLILNSDTTVPPGALDRLIAYLDANPDVGVAGPQLTDPDGTMQPSAANEMRLWTLFLQQSYLDKLFPDSRILGNYFLSELDPGKPHTVAQVNGAAMCVRREVFARIGLMDEAYFMYCEDTDFCRRARQAGWRIHYLPFVKITHLLGASSAQNREQMVIAYNRSVVRLFAKFEGTGAARRARLLTSLGAGARMSAWALIAALPPWPRRARRQAGMFRRILSATCGARVAI
jgi:GT2 family glycosyltransferase